MSFQKENHAFLSIVVFIYMIVISNIQNPVLSLGAIGMCLLFINCPEYLLPILFLTSLFGEYFVAFSGMGMSRIVAILFVVFVVINSYTRNSDFGRRKMILIVMSSALCCISCLFSLTGSMVQAYVFILHFLMLECMGVVRVRHYKKFISVFRWTIVIMTIYILVNVLIGKAVYVYGRLIFHSSLNANSLGMALAQMAAILVALLLDKGMKQNKVIDLITIVIIGYLIILSGSRTSLLAIMGAILFISIYMAIDKRKIRYLLLPLSLVVLTYWIITNSDLDVLVRFSKESVVETGGTGRTEIWKAAMRDVFPNYWFVGVGLGVDNTIAALRNSWLSNNVGIHNMYISILIQTGVVGGCLFFSYFGVKMYQMLKALRFNYFALVPATMFVTMFINGIGEEVFGERFVWMAIGLFAITSKEYERVQNEEFIVCDTKYEYERCK